MDNQKKASDEIDLLELVLKTVNVIRHNFFLIVAFFVLGTALGTAYYYSVKKVYESKIMIRSSILIEPYAREMIDNINLFIKQHNIEELSSQLKISEEAAENLSYLDIEDPVTETLEKENNWIFILTAKVYDPKSRPELQKGLIQYLENNEYVKVRVDQNRNLLRQYIDKINQEIQALEELKATVFKGDFFDNKNGNMMFDPTEINSKIVQLTKEKLQAESDLKLVSSVQLIQGFTKLKKPTSPKLSLSIVAGAFVGLILVSILIAFKGIRKLLSAADAIK
jgi:uncharacterized protein involved in exopolysaccharide biosynthesis